MQFGIGAGGQTTLLYRLKTGEMTQTVPTVGGFHLFAISYSMLSTMTGFNVESIEFEDTTITIWVITWSFERLRPLWKLCTSSHSSSIQSHGNNERG
jgi:hypothetical protein